MNYAQCGATLRPGMKFCSASGARNEAKPPDYRPCGFERFNE